MQLIFKGTVKRVLPRSVVVLVDNGWNPAIWWSDHHSFMLKGSWLFVDSEVRYGNWHKILTWKWRARLYLLPTLVGTRLAVGNTGEKPGSAERRAGTPRILIKVLRANIIRQDWRSLSRNFRNANLLKIGRIPQILRTPRLRKRISMGPKKP